MLLCFGIACLYPVFNLSAEKEYIVSSNDLVCDRFLIKSEKWQAGGFFVYRLADEDKAWAKIIPGTEYVSEYYSADTNSSNTVTPLLQCICDGCLTVYGAPYTVD